MLTRLKMAPDGSLIGVNKAAVWETPGFLFGNQPNASVTMAAGATSDRIILASGDVSRHVYGMAMERTSPCLITLQLQHDRGVDNLMNAPCHVDAIFGSLTKPYWLPKDAPFCLGKQRQLVGLLTNLSDVESNTFYPKLITADYRRSRASGTEMGSHSVERACQRAMARAEYARPYFYTAVQGVIQLDSYLYNTPGPATIAEIEIAQDAHFEIWKISAVSDFPFTVNIYDAETGESIINAPTGANYGLLSTLMSGDGNFQYELEEPYWCPARTKLIVEVQNASGGEANDVYLVIGGKNIADIPFSRQIGGE